jgi:hypothetical protein
MNVCLRMLSAGSTAAEQFTLALPPGTPGTTIFPGNASILRSVLTGKYCKLVQWRTDGTQVVVCDQVDPGLATVLTYTGNGLAYKGLPLVALGPGQPLAVGAAALVDALASVDSTYIKPPPTPASKPPSKPPSKRPGCTIPPRVAYNRPPSGLRGVSLAKPPPAPSQARIQPLPKAKANTKAGATIVAVPKPGPGLGPLLGGMPQQASSPPMKGQVSCMGSQALPLQALCGGTNICGVDAACSAKCCADGSYCHRWNAFTWICMPLLAPTAATVKP